jgi:flavin-dependent dehydrogenase
MGVLDELEGRGAQLRGMIVRAPDGTSARGDYAAAHGFRAFRDRGLAIRRELLDDVLLRRAREAGVRVHERVRVTDILRDAKGAVSGVCLLDAAGRKVEMRAPIVVAADGLRSVVARRLELARTEVWPKRISLIAHYRDVRDVSDYGEMHVERDGFVGIADVGNGVTTVAAVFPARRAHEIAGGADRPGFLDRWLAAKPHLARRFACATREGGTMAVGPFASHARRASHPGALLVGDAADFFDPFTGEGIYSALRGGELVGETVVAALASSPSAEAEAFQSYERTRRREFRGKWWVERLIGVGVASSPIVNRAARALAARKHLADLLVGVTGDFVPAREVLRLSYLAQLLVLPISASSPRPAAWQ